MTLKLNLGAGNKPLKREEGWVNVDLYPEGQDLNDERFDFMICDVIQLPDVELDSVDEILASHLIEHIHPSKVMRALLRWNNVLKPNGKITLEQPDVIKCAINLLQAYTTKEPKMVMNNGLWGLYGNSQKEGDYMNHMWGYYPESLKSLLENAGFVNVKEVTPQVKPWGVGIRDFALTARKRVNYE